MSYRSIFAVLCCFCISAPLSAQLSKDAKYEILRTIVADQASARVALPFGNDGVELTDAGQVNEDKLRKDLQKNGQSIEVGKVVTVTAVAFDDKSIELELDGGGKNKKSILDRIQVGVGTNTQQVPIDRNDKTAKAKGSKITVRFASKVPENLTPAQLKEILNPLLDFNKHNFMKTGIDALPPEFQEAVKSKEARIGMDRSTVIMALGRPNNRFYEKKDGVSTEQWKYDLRGYHVLFVTFEENVVVEIKQY
jgi:hypothetical protein